MTFIDKIEDVTDFVQAELKKVRKGTGMEYLSPAFLRSVARKRVGDNYLKDHPGTEVEIRPFYNGNKYLMFTKKVYSDIRSSVHLPALSGSSVPTRTTGSTPVTLVTSPSSASTLMPTATPLPTQRATCP